MEKAEMTPSNDNMYDALERIFHEPNRLAIMSILGAAGDAGLPFTGIKAACNLTDGNLNRHLKVLEEAGAVRIHKEFVDAKPRTTVRLTEKGLKRFNEYLEALSAVLSQARAALAPETTRATPAAGLRHRAKA
jgi:DNA-binding MarR family transcriptional regulator